MEHVKPEALELGASFAVAPSLSYEELSERTRWHLRTDRDKPMEVQLAALYAAEVHYDQYQERGFGYYLEQGLGKTALALNDYLDHLKRGLVDICVVIAPPTFMADWEVAVAQWMKPEDLQPTMSWPQNPLAPTQSMGPGRPHKKLPPLEPPFLFSINWEMVRRDARGADLLEELCKKYRVFLIEDETSYIKNPQSSVGKGAIDIGKECEFLRGLNGTPLTQNFTDIYSQYRALRLWSGLVFHQFRNRYATVGGYKGKKITGVKPEKLDQLRREIGRHCFRAMKKDWAKSLPPKHYRIRNYQMTDEQMRIYREMELEFYTEVGDAEISADMAVTQRIKLQQIASGFIMDGNRQPHRLMPVDKNPKAMAWRDDMLMAEGKWVVSRFYQESTDVLREIAEGEGKRVLIMKSGMGDELVALKEEFNRNDEVDGMIIPLMLGRMGHTLLGSEKRRCNQMMLYENDYNLLNRLQVEDRIHRWGQDADFCLYTDYAGTSAERDIADALQKKLDMTDMLVNAIRAIPHETGRI